MHEGCNVDIDNYYFAYALIDGQLDHGALFCINQGLQEVQSEARLGPRYNLPSGSIDATVKDKMFRGGIYLSEEAWEPVPSKPPFKTSLREALGKLEKIINAAELKKDP